MKNFLRRYLRRAGFDLVRFRPRDPLADGFPDLSPAERSILARVAPFTMTSTERLAALLGAVRHVHENHLPGDYVECGVWRGGSSMAAALMLLHLGDTTRHLHLYDTYEGMSQPTSLDRDLAGNAADQLLRQEAPQAGIWCYASLDDVRRNLLATGYPADRIHFHVGKVEDTIPAAAPSRIAVLRLDTDWYESTRHELQHLYPRLNSGGLLLIDDYGHWQGARRATDEFRSTLPQPLFLHRIDYTGRLAVKS